MSLNMPKLFTKTELTVCRDKQNLHVVNEGAKPNVNQAVNQRVSESNEDKSNPQHGILHWMDPPDMCIPHWAR